MNYPQEKYDEVRAATGWSMSNATIDLILSIFATALPQVTLEQANEMHDKYLSTKNGLHNECGDFLDAVNYVLAKSTPVIAAKTADGMVSLEDVERVVFDRLCETAMMAGEIHKITDDIHKLLNNPKTPEPTVTLVDAAEGRTLEVPARAVHEMVDIIRPSSKELYEQARNGLDAAMFYLMSISPDRADRQDAEDSIKPNLLVSAAQDVPASKVHKMEYPEAVTYTCKRIYESDDAGGESCGEVVVNKAKHTAFHGRLIERIVSAEQENAALKSRTLSCVFCGEPMASVEALKTHSADCPKHPAVIENAKLKAQVERLSDPVTSVEEISSLATFDNALRNHCGRKQSENAMEQALGWLIASRSAGKEERTTYPHEGHCSCSSYLPVGSPGCCCNRKRMEEHHA
jgi:DNA-directed RNA polymerase subunit M/transcription elongation factor TFIIS